MDVLTNKNYGEFNYRSRYSQVPNYYNKNDDKYMSGITYSLYNNTGSLLYEVMPGDTLDKLSNTYYGRPDLFWVIADYNRITDCFDDLYNRYIQICIPTITSISFNKGGR